MATELRKALKPLIIMALDQAEDAWSHGHDAEALRYLRRATAMSKAITIAEELEGKQARL